MIHKRSDLYLALVGVSVLFVALAALAMASTTWAAPGEQGTIGGTPTRTPPATATVTATPHKGGGCSDCGPTSIPPTPTPLPKLPTTGTDAGNGIGLLGIPLLLVLGAGLVWKGLRLARR
jgi:LPXTG-motif cell wall-anchored protein